ncbi:RNA-binding domain-containing protein [Atractiella rhizophila]|nr:RNA-binding domain-containing protein [Atractiella rhizophila]
MAPSTRLLLLDLPPSLTVSSLRTHILSIPSLLPSSLTDLKHLPKRHMAFVGFKSEGDAQKAYEWIGGSWIGGRRVRAKWAEDIVDKPPEGKNKKRKRSTADEGEEVGKKKYAKSSNWKTLALPNPSNQSTSANANSASTPTTTAPVPPVEEEEQKSLDSDEEEELERQRELENGISDTQWLLSHRARHLSPPPSADPPSLEPPTANPSTSASTSSAKPAVDVETVDAAALEVEKKEGEYTRLFLRNLPFSTTAEELRAHFSTYGELTEVHLPSSDSADSTTSTTTTSNSKKAKGIAYLSFSLPSSAQQAKQNTDGRIFQGRLLHVIPCQARHGKAKEGEEEGEGKKSVKEKRLEEKKRRGGGLEWASLFLNADAVVENVSKRLGVEKDEILDPRAESSINPAVRLAVAETSVISSTRDFFLSRGLNLEAKGAKDDATILVKNLPANTSESLLRGMFEQHGTVERLEVAPSGVMAVVRMASEEDGRSAFRGVAYKRVGNSVVYLEKGPVGLWDGKMAPASTAQVEEEEAKETEPVEVGEGATLFLKNLSFSTTSASLTNTFTHLPGFAFARVQTRPDPKHPTDPSKTLSMGFGFLGFKDKEAAKRALGVVQGKELDGHRLEVKWAQRDVGFESGGGAKKEKKGKSSSKIIVKNLPFEASKKDLRDLFSNYGTLKSVRVPKKFTNKTRGFGFVEFTSKKDAERAMETLKHTHLLGRHLVLQYEEGEKDIDTLREEAKRGGEGKIGARKERMRDFEKGIKDGEGLGAVDEEMDDD